MGKLTDSIDGLSNWLEQFKLSPVPRHDVFPALVKPANFVERVKDECLLCPLAGTTNHESYGCGRITDYLPEGQQTDLRAYMSIQYLLYRLSEDKFFSYGSQSGFMFYGAESVNFSDQYVFPVESVDGTKITVKVSSGDVRAFGIFLTGRGNIGIPGTTYLSIIGTVQANDLVRPSGDCILANKLQSHVIKVTVDSSDVTRAEIECECDMSGLLIDNRENQTSPFSPTVTFVRQAGSPQQWTRVVRSSTQKCQRRVLTVAASDLPENKKLSLMRSDGTNGRVADPEPADEESGKPATMQVWFKRVGVVDLEDVTTQVTGRFKKDSTGAGFDELGAYDSFLCLGTLDHEDEPVFTDLIDETVESVSVIYYAEIPDGYTGKNWCAVGSRSCVHALRDESGSFYAMTDGEAHTSDGKEFYCGERRTWEIVLTGEGRWRLKWSKPTGVHKFTGDCSLSGVCSHYQVKHTGGEGVRPFTLHRTANQILKEVTIGNNLALVQYWPGYPFYYVKRFGRPTIQGLTSGVNPSNPTDWSPNVFFLQGGVFVGDLATGPAEGDSGTVMNPKVGGVWDSATGFHELTFPATPPDGFFAINIPGWQADKIDALRRSYTDENDPHHSLRNYEADMSARVSRGVGSETFGRGVSQTSRIVGGDEKFLLPDLSVADETADIEQDRGDCTFTWYVEDQVGPDGFMYGALIKIKKLIATDKPEIGEIKTAVIYSVALGVGEIIFELVNQPETWSKLTNVGRGNTFNETFGFNTGGKVFRPPDHLQVMSSETEDSSFGNTDDWVSIGDCCWIDHGTDDFKAHRFTVVGGGAYLGSTAPDFGAGVSFVSFDVANGYYQIEEEDLITTGETVGRAGVAEATTSIEVSEIEQIIFFTDEVPFIHDQHLQVDGTNEILRIANVNYESKRIGVFRSLTPSPIPAGTLIRSISVLEDSTDTVFDSIDSLTKPADIETGKFWYDENAARYYFSPLDVNRILKLSFTTVDSSGVQHHDNTTIVYSHQIFNLEVDGTNYFFGVFDTMKTDAEFSIPGTKVFIGETEMEIIETLPTDTQAMKTIDTNSHVVLQFARKFSGDAGRVELGSTGTNTFNSDQPALVPEFSTGIGWGKKRALLKLADENNWLTLSLPDLIGKTIHFERMTQVLSPFSDVAMHFTKYQVDSYSDVAEVNQLLDRGRGHLYLKRAVVDDIREIDTRRFCALLD